MFGELGVENAILRANEERGEGETIDNADVLAKKNTKTEEREEAAPSDLPQESLFPLVTTVVEEFFR